MKKSLVFALFVFALFAIAFGNFITATKLVAVVPTPTSCVPNVNNDCYGTDPTLVPTFTETPTPTNTKRPPFTPTNTPTCEPGFCNPIDPTINPKLGGSREDN